jgi:uncharacterized membrane protein
MGTRGDSRDASSGDDEGGCDPADDADPDLDDLFDEFEDLEAAVDTESERELVREARRTATAVATGGPFGRVIRGYDRADAAEALLGSVLFGIPMVVEGGTLEIGAFLAQHPLLHAGTLVGGIAVVIVILYVADIQEVRVYQPLLGIIPRRLAGVVGISYAVAVVMMVGWGRLDGLSMGVAAASVSAAFVPMAIGAALGDILPGS